MSGRAEPCEASADMPHKILLRKVQGIVAESDGVMLLLSDEEYNSAKKRFSKRFVDSDIRRDIRRASKR